WLPLRSLSLHATLDHPEGVDPGQPVTLTLETTAAGAPAAQLPDLEAQLVSPDFRIYRERTLADTQLTQDGRQLTAKRTEIYTLVPQGSGNLRLPEIKVPWWNLETGSRQVATLPIKTLRVQGGSGPFGLPASLTDLGPGWSNIWLPITGVLLLIAGYWVGVLLYRRRPDRGPRPTRRPHRGLRPVVRALGHGAARAVARLNPRSLAAAARSALVGLLPDSSRLLLCVRHANRAPDPGAWCERFEHSARRLLRSPGQGGTPNLTERILRLRPRADRARVTQLMAQLDAALYGRQALDFPRWKRDFHRQVGRLPSLIRRRRPETRPRRPALPALNPRTG
ncbi:MAG TPA: BatD family protein, partial [Lamprocystis sp. (in: g-proteobacteria)]|nr:BatD family protein [Lamprocystis sp. (in: g-proteobacteria)]